MTELKCPKCGTTKFSSYGRRVYSVCEELIIKDGKFISKDNDQINFRHFKLIPDEWDCLNGHTVIASDLKSSLDQLVKEFNTR